MEQNYEQARKVMVDNQIRPVGVTNLKLLESLGQVCREIFVPENRKAVSYADVDHELSVSGRYLMAPAPFAQLAQLAQVKQSDIVLVVGCGAGYSLAVLADLCSAVVGIDADETLVKQANEALASLNIGNCAVLHKDPLKGVPEEAPFDLILIEGAINSVPPALFSQLRDGGRLLAVISGQKIGKASVFMKSGKNISVHESFDVNIPALREEKKQAKFLL